MFAGRVAASGRLAADKSVGGAPKNVGALRRVGLGPRAVVVRAAADDEDFEARLKRLKEAKGQTPIGEGKKKKKEVVAASKPKYDFDGETLYLETGPHMGDLAINVALSWTLFWLPLTFAAVGRAAWLKYRFTDKRLSVITNSPFRSQQVDVAYQEIKDVVTVGRGVGLWGDMLFVLRNGDKVEMRAVPRWLELKNYINER